MRLVLDLNVSSTLCREGFLRAAVAGLRSTDDASEELLTALETLVVALDALDAHGITDAHVAEVLAACEGNVSKAARALGVARSTVRVKAKRSGFDRPRSPR